MNIKIQKREISSIIITLLIAKMLLAYPRYIIISGGNAAWIQAALAWAAALVIFALDAFLYKTKQNIIELSEELGGKWLKIPTGIVISAVLLVNMAITVRAYPESVTTILLSNNNVEPLLVVFFITMVIGTYCGLESIVRINSIFLPIALTIMAIFMLLLIPHFNLNNLFPIFGTGVKEVFSGWWVFISMFSDLIALNLLLPYCRSRRNARVGGFIAIIICGAIFILILLALALVFPYPAGSEFVLPLYEMTRIVHAGQFFGRFEAFFEFVWSILIMLYSSLYLYLICMVWQKSFDMKYMKPLIIPAAIIVGTISYVPESTVELIHAGISALTITFPIALGLPLVYGLWHKLKNRRKFL